ncbi:MAG: cyclase [Rhodospirillaceae bacterium]|nr:cyclase [Rhodospirillaceae bacterium]
MKNKKSFWLTCLLVGVISLSAMAPEKFLIAQTREEGPWWPSPHGVQDQAGASNYVTPQKILAALQIPVTGQTYELGHMYEPSMPLYGPRPYFLQVIPPLPPTSGEGGISNSEYFSGFIGQMGTQFDGLAHQGGNVQMGDGSFQSVFYNGFSVNDLFGKNRGLGGVEALGVEQMKPFITRGILIDIAGYKGVEALPAAYEVTLEDMRGALARQGMNSNDIEQGDAVFFNYGWSINWDNPSKYNDSYIGVGENEGSPGIYADIVRVLIERKISLVGADSCCVEVRPRPGVENVHRMLFLRDGIPMLENMELRGLAADEVYEFLFIGLPERIKGATGSPMRPIAIR